MGGFELLEHTADVGVVATGDTLGEALAWIAVGMFSVIVEAEDVEPRQAMEVTVASSDPEALVVDWLNELLYRWEADGFLPKEFHVTVDEAHTSLVARCVGEPFDRARHRTITSVKAATYHALQVSHDSGWRIQVILDV